MEPDVLTAVVPMAPNILMAWQGAAFFGPIVVTLIVWWTGWLSGKKTNLNALGSFAAGAEMVRFDFIPEPIGAALISGFAIATLLSNMVLTSRE